jgi:tetratricopeptide (TPR) repeat protein
MAQQRSSLRFYLLTGLACLAALLMLGYVIGRVTGSHVGEEFSAEDFTSRRFSYEVFPVTGWVMRGIEYDNTTPEVCELIVADKLIIPSGKPPRWDLIGNPFSQQPGSDCDARLLVDYLNLKDSDSRSVFVKWNEDFPKCAKVFWPVVAQLARDEMYLAAPDIMEFARRIKEDNVDSFELELNKLTATTYLEFGVLDQQMENHDRAIDRLSHAINLNPSNAAYEARSKSYQATGKADLADRDRQLLEAG